MAKQSLVSQSIPSALATSNVPQVQETFELTPYVQFCSTKSPKFAQWYSKIPDLQDGDPVLFERDVLTALRPFRFFLIEALQWWGVITESGEIIRSTFSADIAKADKSLRECGESVILACLPDRVQVARCTFKGPKCKALKTAMNGHMEASSAEWGSKSQEHKASLGSPDPRFRYTTIVSLRTRTSRSEKGAGYNYVEASGTINPISVPQMTHITDFFGKPENHTLCAEVMQQYRNRIKVIEGKLIK